MKYHAIRYNTQTLLTDNIALHFDFYVLVTQIEIQPHSTKCPRNLNLPSLPTTIFL